MKESLRICRESEISTKGRSNFLINCVTHELLNQIFRLDKASAKIDSLKGSKKAIRIYSSAKYPIANPPKFQPTFQQALTTNEIDFNYNLQNVPAENIDFKRYSDKLQFFHLKRSRQQISEKPNLVFNTKSINSLITFVNNENIVLNEISAKSKPKDFKATVENELDDTTDFSSFSTRMKTKHDNEHFHYFPNMMQAPEIDLPMDLPDLPGIADDISFSIPDQELIAPSLAKMNIVNDLPNVAELMEAESTKKLQEIQQPSEEKTKTKVVEPPPVPINIPPPPPIPQNFVPLPPPIPKESAKVEHVSLSEPKGDDVRSSLMQAIRNAGGKSKLRSIPAADEQPTVASKKKPQAPPTGDLMSDLHAKLAMRRRGIAGSKEAKKEKASLMDKVSSLIPPPPKRTADSSDDDSSSTENDWD